MYLGTRSIRSAGRTSGSIEITLPTTLQVLEGVECRLTVRDGPRPEIMLQPDLSAAQSLFSTLWQKLRLGLGEVDELGDFSPADFTLALFPPRHWQERPPLAYVDALAVVHQRTGHGQRGSDALTRLLAFLAVAGGHRLGLEGALALAFGDAVVYLITGTPAGLGTDFERGMAHRTFWGDGGPQHPAGSPFDDQVWLQARSGFRRVYDQFRTWQENPEVYAAAREKWYRALTIEIGVRSSSVEQWIDT
ncbi:MAG: hypothetical protein M5U01_32995 [Ardenticatenaceae bacterium]|nr:hypothetical protein [Ardenticatenaceae bacterium]HBY99593.1 hypothetical protein [Chloroflexota bacterium]